MISCENGFLNLATREIHDHSPALFNVVSVPFAYDEDAPLPAEWFAFLDSVWPDDPDSVMLLQEYIGYILSGRTDLQKMLLLIGPTRSGKGTIARMLAALVGRGHTVGPTLASLGTNFGLSPLLGRPLAVVSDARLSGNSPTSTIVERLLSISGEDLMTVDRKYRDPWSGKLPTRFVILSNELPKFRDSSGAIANRLLILQMTESFLGREDPTLDDRLAAELPGILMWALEGLDRLVRNGRFTVPGASADAANLMMDLASPISAFVRDRCVRDVNATVERDVLYHAWKDWAEENGHMAGAKSTFGRDLRAVVPELRTTNPRICGVPVRHYTRIGLQCQNLDGVYPASPASVSEPAGQVDNGDADRGSAILHQPTFTDPSPMTDAGNPSSDGAIKPLLSGGDAGDAGRGASKVQHRTANAAYLNGQCRDGCGRRHSPGRTRCDECHRVWQTTVDGYER
jgi:putative DNA primase/helicase